MPCPRGRKRKAFRILLDVAVSTGGGRPVRNSPANIGKAGRCHGAGSARSVGTDHKASTKPRPHSSSDRWKGVAAHLRTAIPRRPSLRQFPPPAPKRQVDAPADRKRDE